MVVFGQKSWSEPTVEESLLKTRGLMRWTTRTQNVRIPEPLRYGHIGTLKQDCYTKYTYGQKRDPPSPLSVPSTTGYTDWGVFCRELWCVVTEMILTYRSSNVNQRGPETGHLEKGND